MKAPLKGHNPEWTIDAALRFIDEHKDGPFYLQYSTTLLHGPNGEWFRSLDKPLITGDRILNEPIGIMDRASVMQRIEEAGLTSNEAGYLWMDDSLGMLLDRLDKHKIADNTIVLFLADHGSVNKGSLLKFRGTEVPCVIRWPNGIQAGVNCDELLQNTDFVPTWFDVARIDVPAKYRLDGVSLLPLFNEPETPVRTHVYGEMGPARSIKTKQWNYIALRYTREQIETIETEHRSVKKLLGLSGGVSRAKVRPHAFDVDQLYSLSGEPERTEFLNHANDPAYRKQLRQMKRLLKKELTKFTDRPFGEFIPGSNAVDGQDQRHLAPLLKKAVAASK